ncbi:MAG: hypothetical protein U1E32_09180 [Rhodoglobus sp.]|jgi:hypothetical protein|nr:hypothetical protein [Rhodoglobus sp.]
MAEKTVVRETSAVSTAVKLIVSVAAIVVGLFLVFGATTPAVADGVFVGSIALVLAVYLWTGVTVGQGRVISVVLALVAAYAFIRGFGLLELALIRQLGGITAIVSGVILLLPFVRAQLAKRKE